MVSVDDRVAIPSGTVTNWWYRYLSRNSAWNAPGVGEDRDHVHITN